ncbi:6362_t:CDS:2 [Funneliformis mosseae]|uniref:6362_t:CDS:1 n=1 Tax=Funneliformis mosseae TaxID=27381 RepID=A0A9N9B9W6_FUNMO|nr:6362_t:CDS:2 [Funneliformis mosseae]
MDNEWKNAKSKLGNLFTDNKTRGTIKGQLLRMDMKNRLEYFEGNDEVIKASLNTLLLDEHQANPPSQMNLTRSKNWSQKDQLTEMQRDQQKISFIEHNEGLAKSVCGVKRFLITGSNNNLWTYRDFSFLLNSTTTWYLADGITSPKLVHAITVVPLSPNGIATKDFQEYEKRHPIEYFMAGGIPRYVLQNAEVSIRNLVGNNILKEGRPDAEEKEKIEKQACKQKIQKKLEETSWVDCLHKIRHMRDPYLASARGFLFECYVIHLFREGGDQFFIHGEPKVGHINIVSDLLKYPEENTVIVPDKQNFGAADLFVTPRSILQVTVSENHPIKQAELVKIINEMPIYINDKNTKLQLYFAVPDEIYDKFKHQQYTTRDKDSQKDLPVKTKNSTLRNVEQWAKSPN